MHPYLPLKVCFWLARGGPAFINNHPRPTLFKYLTVTQLLQQLKIYYLQKQKPIQEQYVSIITIVIPNNCSAGIEYSFHLGLHQQFISINRIPAAGLCIASHNKLRRCSCLGYRMCV